jgi:hypothetical protein
VTLKEIKTLKNELIVLYGIHKSFLHPEVYKKSKELDILILEKQKESLMQTTK